MPPRHLIAATLAAALIALTAAALAYADEALKVGKSVPQAFWLHAAQYRHRATGIFGKERRFDVEAVDFGGAPFPPKALISNAVDGLGPRQRARYGEHRQRRDDQGGRRKGRRADGADHHRRHQVSNINTVADLKGKGISVSQPGSLTGWLVSTLSAQQGWGRDGIKLVIMNLMSAVLSALVSNQVDGITVDLSTALKLQNDNHGKMLVKRLATTSRTSTSM